MEPERNPAHSARRRRRRGPRPRLRTRRARARQRAAEVRHHRYRRRDRRLLRGRRRHLPARQQGPRQARPSLLRGVDRRLGIQRQHDQGRRARFRHDAVRRAVPGLQRHRPVQGGRQRPARGVLRASGAIHGRCAQGSQHQAVHRFQGQALQCRQSGLGHALGDGRASRCREHEDLGLRARLRAEGGRARAGAVRQQDRRLLLRRGPPLGQHPGPDDCLRREARLAHRPRDRRTGEEVSVLRLCDDSRRDVREQSGADQDLRRAGDARELVEGFGRHRLHHHQGRVREHRRVQEAPSGVRQPRPEEHDQGRAVGAAA